MVLCIGEGFLLVQHNSVVEESCCSLAYLHLLLRKSNENQLLIKFCWSVLFRMWKIDSLWVRYIASLLNSQTITDNPTQHTSGRYCWDSLGFGCLWLHYGISDTMLHNVLRFPLSLRENKEAGSRVLWRWFCLVPKCKT